MIPIRFKGCNRTFGENQPEYQPLPALVMPGPQGECITCWELTPEEVETVTTNKRIFLKQLTFNQALQPVLPMADLGDDTIIHPETLVEVVARLGGLQPWVDKTSWMLRGENLALHISIQDDRAEVSAQGFGSCQPLIAKTPVELIQCINIWFRNR